MKVSKVLKALGDLTKLDPLKSYPQRGAACIAKMVQAKKWRLELVNQRTLTSGSVPSYKDEMFAIALKMGTVKVGMLEVGPLDKQSRLDEELKEALSALGRVFARCLHYAEKLEKLTEFTVEAGADADDEMQERIKLTPREWNVVELLLRGASTKEIAEKTGLTKSTINTYLKRIFSKLGVHSRIELVAKVMGIDKEK